MIRLYVMGDDARRAATADEIAAMCDVLRACLDAGAVGLSTSYVDVEDDMLPVPCRFAEHRELEALCAVLGEHDRMLQIVHEFFDTDLTVSRIEMLGDLSRRFGIPTTLSPLFHSGASPTATDRVMAAVTEEWTTGARVWPQVQTRPIDISWTLDQRSIMFLVIPGWWKVLSMSSKADKLEALADPATRAMLVGGLDALSHVVGIRVRRAKHRRPRGGARPQPPSRWAARWATSPPSGAARPARRSSTSPSRKSSARGSSAPTSATSTSTRWARCWPTRTCTWVPATRGAHVGSFATYGDTGYLFSQFVREAPAR